MKVFNFALIGLLAGNLVAATDGLSTWKEKDVKHFLKDRQIDFSEKESFQELSRKAEEEFEKLKNIHRDTVRDDSQQHILATNPKDELTNIFPAHINWNYLFESNAEHARLVKNWIFESWSTEGLKDFLTNNKIKFDKNYSKQDLIDLAQKEYDNIAEGHDVSGYYPGDWIYQGWSVDRLKQWLQDHELEFDSKDNRESLLSKVKHNNYIASLSNIDNKNSLLDSLDLAQANIFDKAGEIKDEFFDTWSYGQLREWLYYHGFISTRPGVYVEELDADKLKKIAKSQQNYLVSDIKKWSEKAKKTADPYLSKGADKKKTLDNVINDTFLIGVEKWSKDRLKEFLRSRNVKFSQFASKHQLVDLVKKSKNVKLALKQNANPASWLVENWSTDRIREWLENKGENVKGTREDLINGISNYVLQHSLAPSDTFDFLANLYKPDLDDYKKSFKESFNKFNEDVKDSGGKAKEALDSAVDSSVADKTMLAAYSIGAEYYKQAAKTLGEKYSESKFSIDDALSQAKDASYEYANRFVDDASSKYADNKPVVEEQVKSAGIAASEFANSLSNSLTEQLKSGKAKLNDVTNDPQEYLKSVNEIVEKSIKDKKPIAEQAAKDAYKVAQDYLASANDAIVKNYGEYKPAAEDALKTIYGSAKDYANSANEALEKGYGQYRPKAVEAAKKAKEYADAINEAAGKNFEEYEGKIQDAYKAASDAASAAYAEYKPIVDSTAKNAYDTAKQYAGSANEAIQSTYAETIPKVENAAKSGWEYLLVSYSNADLRSYLQSFGYNFNLLSTLTRQQLVNLANEQSDIFFGSDTKWDKSIVDVLKDTSDGFQEMIGIKPKEESIWSKVKNSLF